MITEYHFDNLGKLTLLTGSILFYAYAMEYFIGWYSGNTFEQTTFFRRAFGPMWWAGWTMIICNAFVSQLLWFKKIRTNLTALFLISLFINLGMWFERFVIIASSLSNDYLPYAWQNPYLTWADWGILIGSFGWFLMYFLLFARTFPIVAIQEIKEIEGVSGVHVMAYRQEEFVNEIIQASGVKTPIEQTYHFVPNPARDRLYEGMLGIYQDSGDFKFKLQDHPDFNLYLTQIRNTGGNFDGLSISFYFDHHDYVEICAVAAFYAMVGRMLDAMGIELEPEFVNYAPRLP